MIQTAKRLAGQVCLAATVYALTTFSFAQEMPASWVDRVFSRAKAIHVAKEMSGFTANLQLREAFLSQMITGNNKEIRHRSRLGGQVPNINWPKSDELDYWKLRDTLDLIGSFEDYRKIAIKDYNEKLVAARKLKLDLISTGSALDLERMRDNDWTVFQSYISGDNGDNKYPFDPTLSLMLSDEYARNYPQALADSFWFYRGEAALSGGYYDDAIIAYGRIVNQEGSSFRKFSFTRLAFLYSEIGDQERSEENWKAWIAAGKPNASEGRIQFFTGRLRYESGDYSGALEALREINSNSIYALETDLLLGMCYGMVGQYDAALKSLQPIVSNKLLNEVTITAEMKIFAQIKFAQIQNLAGHPDDALKTLTPLNSQDMFGDQVLISRAWIFRSIPKYSETISTLDTLITRAGWSPYVPLASAWKAEIAELEKGTLAALPAYEKLLSMVDQNQQLLAYSEERYKLYELDNKLSLLEGDILRANDIGLFAKFLDQRNRNRLLIQKNRHGAALVANPALAALYEEEIAVSKMKRDLAGARKEIDFEHQGSVAKKYFKVEAKTHDLSTNLEEMMSRASQFTPALQRQADVAAFNKQVRILAQRSRELIDQYRPDQTFNVPDRAVLTNMHFDEFNAKMLTSKLDEVETDINRAAGFALARYALGGFDFDVLQRERERSDELTNYIKKLENALAEKKEADEEAKLAEPTEEPKPSEVSEPVSPSNPTTQPEKK